MDKVIDLNLDHKTYRKGSSSVTLLEHFSLTVAEGEKVAIVGESGVGKSTLLNILGLLDTRYEGSYRLLGRSARTLSDLESAAWRNQKIGFVLQESALIGSLSIADNIRLPLLYARTPRKGDSRRFDQVVDSLGIGSILSKKPLECSGGEKSRAVFARAVIMNPEVVLADEPTASLDSENRSRIIALLFALNHDSGSTIVTVTHDASLADQHDRIIKLQRKD